jgi:AhpD family alkylhydroperoxidase
MFSETRLPLKPQLLEACTSEWERIGAAGTWWRDSERVTIAQETRSSRDCLVCQSASAAGSDIRADRHDGTGELSAAAVEAAHTLSRTPELLASNWYQSLVSQLEPAQYVEIVGVVATVKFVDTLAHAVGASAPDLPTLLGGEPTRVLPGGLNLDAGWVPTVDPDQADGNTAAAYAKTRSAWGFVTNMRRALTLVPAEQDGLTRLGAFYYRDDLELNKAQIELAASRVSHLNGCSYCMKLHTRLLRRAIGQGQEDAEALVAGVGVDQAPIDSAREIEQFAVSALSYSSDEMDVAREKLCAAIGPVAAGDLAGIVACFDAVNRVTAGTGSMFDEQFAKL